MKKMSEGRKMWISVMVVFAIYAVTFLFYEDFDRKYTEPFGQASDWHLLLFSIIVMIGLGWLLYGYARRMDDRISREQQQKQNQLRRELTQNIAHELKTPVSSILAYTDTILENPSINMDTRQQFLVRTNAQARRLSSLLQDISTLNKMDYATDFLKRERVDISVLVADIVLESEPALAEHQMTFKNYMPQSICIQGNWQLLYSIFRNLTDNAIYYAGNGTCIELYAKPISIKANEILAWQFTFRDNGCGIPQQHLSRLFERFYRVDKGRSRSLGGTGLGLAIVKNAVAFHGGDILVSNHPEGGLQFVFTLKKNSTV